MSDPKITEFYWDEDKGIFIPIPAEYIVGEDDGPISTNDPLLKYYPNDFGYTLFYNEGHSGKYILFSYNYIDAEDYDGNILPDMCRLEFTTVKLENLTDNKVKTYIMLMGIKLK